MVDVLLQEVGDRILQETEDYILLEIQHYINNLTDEQLFTDNVTKERVISLSEITTIQEVKKDIANQKRNYRYG